MLALAVAWAGLGTTGWASLQDQVVVVANSSVPESIELAKYYALKRGIAETRLCFLDLPPGELMSRGEYEKRLRDPLLSFLREQGLAEQQKKKPGDVKPHQTAWLTTDSSVRYIVSMYGVPVRIADTKTGLVSKLADRFRKPEYKNTASVDTELALLLHPGYDIDGAQPNPYYGGFARALINLPQHEYLVASRLDGPDADTVRRMIDDTLDAEHYGMQGRCYFDSRSLTDEYFIGDYWLRESYERFLRAGYECVFNAADAMWSKAYPMEDVAAYMGWYTEHMTGPFEREDFTFMRGAIGYHIHSASAGTVRSRTLNWVGPLLSKGAVATAGAVSEPYLSFTPHLNILTDRLFRGLPFGDSIYMSMTRLSWEITVIGDPLYRPFKYTLDEQIEHLREDGLPELEWAMVRKVNLLIREGRFYAALRLCTEEAEALDSLVLREKLGDIYGVNDRYAEAGDQYIAVLERTKRPAMAVRVATRWLLILRLLGETEKADAFEASIKKQWEGNPMLAWLEQKSKP